MGNVQQRQVKEFNKVLQIVSIRLYKHDQYSGKTNEFKLSNQKKKRKVN